MYAEAIRSLDRALSLGRIKDIQMLEAKKICLKALEKHDEVIKVCDSILKLDPKEQGRISG